MLNKEGMLIGEIIVEGYCEINGLLIPKIHKTENDDNNNNNNNNSNNGNSYGGNLNNGNNSMTHLSSNSLYFTDKNFSGVKRIKLSQLTQEADKLNENKY